MLYVGKLSLVFHLTKPSLVERNAPRFIVPAQKSPKSGKFLTNINAKDWHLISPDGKEYKFHCLNYWLRENCDKLFGCMPDSKEFRNVSTGLSGAKRAMLGKKYGCCTYKGWKVIPTEHDIKK